MKHITSSLLILFLSLATSAQDFEIIRENKTSEHELGINKYSFVHHVGPDSFYMTELYHDLDYDDMANIVREIYNGVTEKDKVQVRYEYVKPAAAKVTYSVQDSPNLGEIFVMFTNFSNATRQFEVAPDPKDQLARWYFLKDDRLVYRKDLYSAETEKAKLESDRKSDLIKYYLFDDNSENDDQIRRLLDKILVSEDKGGPDKYFAQIYNIQNHLMNGRMEDAGDALNNLEVYFNQNSEIPRNQKIYLDMVKAEYEIMKRI